MLKAVVVGAKNNLANQTFMSYDMTLIDYMKDRIPKNVLWKLPSTVLKIRKKVQFFIIVVLEEKSKRRTFVLTFAVTYFIFFLSRSEG